MGKKNILFLASLLLILLGVGAFAYNGYAQKQRELLEQQAQKQQGQSVTSGQPAQNNPPAAGQSGPVEFELTSLEGKKVRLSDYRGKVVVVNFWASWCPPCKAEMPELEEVHKAFAKSGDGVLLAVNLTDGGRETKATAKKYIEDGGYTFPVLLDEGTALAMEYGIYSIPQTYIIDKEGRIVDEILGMTDKETILKKVEAAQS